MGSVTGLRPGPELAAALHRLRSVLARMKAEVELAADDGLSPSSERVLSDLSESLSLLGAVEAAAFALTPVLVIDDDARLGELTARGLRRFGFDAESVTSPRPLRSQEVVVLDLGLVAALDVEERKTLKASRPIVVTGAADPASRELASSLDASDYLLKPVELEELAAAITRHVGSRLGSHAERGS